MGLTPWLANVGSFAAANVGSYLLNARITFRRAGAPAGMSAKAYATFFSAHAASLAISTGVVALLAAPIGALFAKLVAVVFTVAWNYAASAFLVFKEPGKS